MLSGHSETDQSPLSRLHWWRNGRMSDFRSRGPGFDFRSGHYQVVTTWMGNCLRTGKPSGYITTLNLNQPFIIEANRVPACMPVIKAGRVHMC